MALCLAVPHKGLALSWRELVSSPTGKRNKHLTMHVDVCLRALGPEV